jgi:hypothetical protein
MKTQLSLRIGLIKPVKALVVGRTIKATDRAWKEAMFGLGGSRRRIGGIRLGTIDGQPLALIAELQTEVFHEHGHWTIESEKGLYALIGPAAVYNDAGFGPATLGISIDRLKELVTFNPNVVQMAEGLKRTLALQESDNDGRRLV